MKSCLICQKTVYDECNIQDIILFKPIKNTVVCSSCCTKAQLKQLLSQYLKQYDYILANQIGELMYRLYFSQTKGTLFLTRGSIDNGKPVVDEAAELLRYVDVRAYHINVCKLPCFSFLTPQIAQKRRVKQIVILSVNGILHEEYLFINQWFKGTFIKEIQLSHLVHQL